MRSESCCSEAPTSCPTLICLFLFLSKPAAFVVCQIHPNVADMLSAISGSLNKLFTLPCLGARLFLTGSALCSLFPTPLWKHESDKLLRAHARKLFAAFPGLSGPLINNHTRRLHSLAAARRIKEIEINLAQMKTN